MAKPRIPGTPEAALDRIAGLLMGYRDVAAILGKSESMCRHYADPDQVHEINFRQAMTLDLCCQQDHGEAPFFELLRFRLSEVEYSGSRPELREAMLEATVALGHLAEAVRAARAPTSPGGHRITDCERAQLGRAVACLESKLANIKHSIAPANVAAFPKKGDAA